MKPVSINELVRNSGLTKLEDVQRFRKSLEALDKNNDGKLDLKEVLDSSSYLKLNNSKDTVHLL